MEHNWQINFRELPDLITRKLARIEGPEIVVAAVKNITAAELRSGQYKHLDMGYKEDSPQFPARIMPPTVSGKFSTWNVQGQEIIRRDLPMITKSYTMESPNFGDWSKGSHDVTRYRDVYRRDFVPPRGIEFLVTLLRAEPGDDPKFVFRFRVEQVLDKTSVDFAEELFSNVNLLQENVGVVDVFPSQAELADYLKTISVQWEILPPGERTETLNHVLSKYRNPSETLKKKLLARYALLEKLKPIAYISGTSGFTRYFGAQFKDDLVVFENLEYGNAIYVMFENWEALSKLSRIHLLRNREAGFERIVHRSGWEEVLKMLVGGRTAA